MATVVVVEDDETFREELAEELRYRGHTVQTAGDGEAGFETIRRARPDVVLSDVNMPVQNGFDLVRRVRSHDRDFADIAFLFISGQRAADDVMRGLKTGADDYITKPIDFDYLDAKISAVMRSQERLYSFWSLGNLGAQFREASFAGAMAVGAVFVIGVVALLGLYVMKSTFGIDIFADHHLSDFLGL